jgi:ubiquinone/menaquinone biosynthesis C-methylase UbiE
MATEERAGHHWQEPERVAEYIDRMDQQEAERSVIFDLMAKLVPANPDAAISVLDVGSGYGPVAAAVLDAFPNAHAIGMDISDAMMVRGRERMARFGDRFEYMVGDFADGSLPEQAIAAGPFDLVVSARAIHHLPAEGMASLYASIGANIKPGGAFFNLDTASPESDLLEDVFRKVRRAESPSARPTYRSPEQQAHDTLLHHKNATLQKHLDWLHAAGFSAVDCFWKRMNRALVGGYKA